jgi:glycosyltransferase involved in cell wall biosynthesis
MDRDGAAARPVRLMHLITDLDVGGAETMLAKLVESIDRRCFPTVVVSLLPPGPIGARLTAAGLRVETLGMRAGRPDWRGLRRLLTLLREHAVDLLQTWLYHADLLGLIAARLARVPHLAWNLRCSEMDPRRYSRLSAALPRLLAWLSPGPDLVVVNSQAGRMAHERLGYRPRRWEVVPNGFDIERFRPDPGAAGRLRAWLGWPPQSFVICLPARFDPMKDHANFLAAAALFARDHQQARFLLVGRGVEAANAVLAAAVRNTGCGDRIALLGERADMAELMAASDLVTLSSAFGEGFPNVLGEAMACGVPVVATDIGDAAMIVAETGVIVPPRDAAALAAGWRRLFDLDVDSRAGLGRAARRRVVENYALRAIVARYEALYAELGRAGPRG